MGWGDCGNDSNGRPIGYNFVAICGHEGCNVEIDRGLSYACGDMHGQFDEYCEKYFCAEHLTWSDHCERQICIQCYKELDEAIKIEEPVYPSPCCGKETRYKSGYPYESIKVCPCGKTHKF